MIYKNYNTTIKNLNRKIADLQELKKYLYNRQTIKIVKQKIKDLKKELEIIQR